MLSSSAKLAISIGKINFVKKLGKYSFKRGKNSLHSKPHAIPLKEVEKAEKVLYSLGRVYRQAKG